ncbi:hypothetical protein BU17DRAFT_69205 [Hysterangium stoloniferum]|nr:hypothetical protein BU17DRAFT_69205 [Hysterangium stoloniferum]
MSRGPQFLDRHWTPISAYIRFGLALPDFALACIAGVLMTLTTLMDVRQLIGNGLVLGFLIKLLVFSLFRTAFFGVGLASGIVLSHVTHGHLNEFPSLVNLVYGMIISQSLYPFLVFLLFGLHRDILRLWFPCIFSLARRQMTDSESMDAVSQTFTEHGHVCYDIRPVDPSGLVESSHHITIEETNGCGTEDAKSNFIELR